MKKYNPLKISLYLLGLFFVIFGSYYLLQKTNFTKRLYSFNCKKIEISDFDQIFEINEKSRIHCYTIYGDLKNKKLLLSININSSKEFYLSTSIIGKKASLVPSGAINVKKGNRTLNYQLNSIDDNLTIFFDSYNYDRLEFISLKIAFSDNQQARSESDESLYQSRFPEKAYSFLQTKVKMGYYSQLSDLEKAIALNQFVFNFCTSEPPLEKKQINLFTNCRTKCGGFAMILAELLNASDIKTRMVSLYNIPIQGNHSLIEAYIENHWILLDPTYGTIFSKKFNIKNHSDFLGIDDLVYENFFNDASKYLYQAKKSSNLKSSLYDPDYSNMKVNLQNMTTSNYVTPEAFGAIQADRVFHLNVSLDTISRRSFGVKELINVDTDSQSYIDASNELLNDLNPNNDISYMTSWAARKDSGSFFPIIEISSLIPGKQYMLTFTGYKMDQKSLSLHYESNIEVHDFLLKEENHVLGKIRFTPTEKNTHFIISTNGSSRIFSYNLEPLTEL